MNGTQPYRVAVKCNWPSHRLTSSAAARCDTSAARPRVKTAAESFGILRCCMLWPFREEYSSQKTHANAQFLICDQRLTAAHCAAAAAPVFRVDAPRREVLPAEAAFGTGSYGAAPQRFAANLPISTRCTT